VQARLRRAAPAFAAVVAAIGAAVISPSAGNAERPRQVGELRAENRTLAARQHGAVLELYALDSRLEHSRAELASLRGRLARLQGARVRLARQLTIARQTLGTAERHLSERLLALYQQDPADALAIVLGSETLAEALAGIDGLNALAAQDLEIADRTRDAKRRLSALSRQLAGQTATLRRTERGVAARTAALEQERAAREQYLSNLAAQRRLNAGRIAGLERAAQAARERTRLLSQPAATPAGPLPTRAEADASTAPVAGARSLTVVATGYAIAGRTATGIPTGPGVVAVDPAVIPLGTRLTIPGYGEGVAADVGTSVQGARIDVWFGTRAQALAWGQRTITVVLH
jgi:3D (Asp-Asp-Asp) domain-containing protein